MTLSLTGETRAWVKNHINPKCMRSLQHGESFFREPGRARVSDPHPLNINKRASSSPSTAWSEWGLQLIFLTRSIDPSSKTHESGECMKNTLLAKENRHRFSLRFLQHYTTHMHALRLLISNPARTSSKDRCVDPKVVYTISLWFTSAGAELSGAALVAFSGSALPS